MTTELEVVHGNIGCGFFSCCSVKLSSLLDFSRANLREPGSVDYTRLFAGYNPTPEAGSIHHLFFDEDRSKRQGDLAIVEDGEPRLFDTGSQFVPYRDLKLDKLSPWVAKYFSPSRQVAENIALLRAKYPFAGGNVCSVVYRGNDKSSETAISSCEHFIAKADEALRVNPDVVFHVQTDEQEFREEFSACFPNSFFCEEVPAIRRSMTNVTEQTPMEQRITLATNLLSLIWLASQSQYVITHSGNVGVWCVLFRGSVANVCQTLDNKWVSDFASQA